MILALSPHLDDVVFSCAGYLLASGRPFRVATVFTASVPRPTGFALTCQTDKGLGPEVDYMALRRREDAQAVRLLGGDYEHWPLREAPHRGYDSAAALFAGARAADRGMVADVAARVEQRLRTGAYREVLYPVGAGNHVDHLQLIAAVESLRPRFPGIAFRQYFDQPYTNKFPERTPSRAGATTVELGPAATLRKTLACGAYRTQLRFQFGGAGRIHSVLGGREWVRTVSS